ncbi:MAG: flagellar hook-associated protein FlgL [Candidatus Competibacteraceae bacterium]|nr:flagellar hook-associated protein FlgL [Candidatus Competibacteraceae bacterium]
MRISTHWIYQRGVKPITDHLSKLGRVQEEISSGQKILKPADDPNNSARLMELHKQVQINEQYGRNIIIANSRLAAEETAVRESGNLLQRVRELTIQANNAALNDENREIIATEIGELRSQLLDIANTRDGDGAYVFAGFLEQTIPFTVSDGEVVYNGDQGQRWLQVGPSRQVAVGDHGEGVFMNIRKGNEQLLTKANVRNTGNAEINDGSIIDPTEFQNNFLGHEYRIEFNNNGSNITFDIIEVTNGVDNPAPLLSNQSYVSGQPINFRGMQVVISHPGADPEDMPQDGDAFTVKAAQNLSIFKVLDNLVTTLETPSQTSVEDAIMTEALANALNDIDQSMRNLNLAQGRIGSRMNALDAQDDVNQNFNLQLKTLQSDIGAVDYADAATRLNEELLALQASQQSFAKIQGLSLFDYLR